jgi:hypothetical protein
MEVLVAFAKLLYAYGLKSDAIAALFLPVAL